jgi:dihydrofolate reductase
MSYDKIVAMNLEGVIGVTGVDGKQYIPWLTRSEATKSDDEATAKSKIADVIREDMRHFRKKTTGNIVVMGRKTFDSLPNGPLPNRVHVVLTRRTNLPEITNVYFTTLDNLDATINNILLASPKKKVFVCGGEEIYRLLMPKCNRLHITEIPYTIDLREGESVSRFVPREEWSKQFQYLIEENRVFKVYQRNSNER